jgi:hypothetical protein
MSALPDDLSRTRALFEHWRATRSGREKIPEALWQAVIALRNRYPASPLCRELHLSAGALRARLRKAEAPPATTNSRVCSFPFGGVRPARSESNRHTDRGSPPSGLGTG